MTQKFYPSNVICALRQLERFLPAFIGGARDHERLTRDLIRAGAGKFSVSYIVNDEVRMVALLPSLERAVQYPSPNGNSEKRVIRWHLPGILSWSLELEPSGWVMVNSKAPSIEEEDINERRAA